ncbi:MAG: hemerythrin domain-containing protein [Bacteroidota bacterium]
MSQGARTHLADDLVRVHRAITRGLTVAQERGAHFVNHGFPDLISRQGYLDYGRCLLAILRGHHDAEDTVIFPRLLMVPGVPFRRLHAEHQRLAALLDAADGAIEAAAVARFVRLLAEVEDLWQVHIASEEQHLTAEAIDRSLSPFDQSAIASAIAEHAMRTVKPEYLALPFFLYNLDREDRAIIAHKLSPVVFNELVPGAWKEKWAPMKPFFLD